MHAFERLNALARINSAKSYLEIGVNKGGTFLRIDVSRKVAVDPEFQFNPHDYSNPAMLFYQVTSDDYFSKIATSLDQFDLIFLDGLHTFEQTFRDFCASLAHSHAKTIWVIDDVNPVSWASSSRRQRQLSARIVRFAMRDRRQHWMGDVFKTVFAIHDFFPQFNYATFNGHGQTVVWRQSRKHFLPTWDSLAKISRLSYWKFLKIRKTHLNISEEDAIIARIESAMR